MVGGVNVVVLHKTTVQEQLFVDDLTSFVHGMEVVGRVGVVRTSGRGFPAPGGSERVVVGWERVGWEIVERRSLAGLGRVALSHCDLQKCIVY